VTEITDRWCIAFPMPTSMARTRFFSDQSRVLTGRKPCFDHAISMPNQSVGSNDYPLGTTCPAPHPWDAPDPLPVMRREMKLLLIEISKLRVEVERLRGTEQEVRYLSTSLNQTMESRDEWRREAECLRALLAKVTPWSLLWWRCLETFGVARNHAPAGQI
jgi:hypothetical protein